MTSWSSSSFKSPRECYKLGTPIQGEAVILEKFQVPKGMLQTFNENQVKKILKEFQVPKGMLQTFPVPDTGILMALVSSPQGNATNTFGAY